jgi:hypothetical protein
MTAIDVLIAFAGGVIIVLIATRRHAVDRCTGGSQPLVTSMQGERAT